MRRMIMLLMCLTLAVSGTVYASGLAIPEQGAAAMSMSAAMTARSEDLSAIFYNPAGLDYVDDTEVSLGIIPITPGHSFSGSGGSLDAEGQTFFPPQLYGAKRINEKLVIGLGVYAPFGLGTDWGTTWDGRYVSTNAAIQCVNVNPSLSYQLNEMISLGAGLSYIHSSAVIEKMTDTGLSLYSTVAASNPAAADPTWAGNKALDSQFKLDGTGSGFGFNIGALVRPMPKLQLGISYRGATELEYDGDATFKHAAALKSIPLGPGVTAHDAISAKMPAKQGGTATLNLPWMLNLGAMYEISSKWDASVDLDMVGWSVYEELAVDFEDNLPMDKQVLDKDWENTFVFRLGTSYDATDVLTVRGGFLYDQSPIPDATFDCQLPGSDRIGLSLGAGYCFGNIMVDAGYMFLSFADRTKDNLVGYQDANADGSVDGVDQATLNAISGGSYPVGNGDYESYANLVAVSVSYVF
jgi:long-chain fatty acid transport protein